MRFVQHPTNSVVLGAPKEWDQKTLECGALPVTLVATPQGGAMVSYWELDEDDRRAIAAGAKIKLWVHGSIHPVVALEVSHD